MSTEEEIEKCVEVTKPDVIMHTNSTYPCPVEELNLRYMEHMRKNGVIKPKSDIVDMNMDLSLHMQLSQWELHG